MKIELIKSDHKRFVMNRIKILFFNKAKPISREKCLDKFDIVTFLDTDHKCYARVYSNADGKLFHELVSGS